MPGDSPNGTWKIVAMLALGGTLGGGAGTLTGALAQEDRVRTIVAASPEIAVIKAIQQEIRQDVEALAVEQKVTGDKVSEVDRKLDRLLFIVEQNGDPSR